MVIERPKQDITTVQNMLYSSHGFKLPARNRMPMEPRGRLLADMSRDVSTRGSVMKEQRAKRQKFAANRV